MTALDFHYDIVCPFAYLASTQIAAIAAEAGAEVRWRPVLLGGVLRAVGTPDVPMDHMPAAKVDMIARDARRRAELLGVPLVFPAGHPRRTVDAMRLCVAAPDAVRPALTADLYRAYWVEGRDVTDRAVLADVAARHGLDAAAILADPAVKAALHAATDAAVARGVFGVPAIFVGADPTLYWGVDRLDAVRAALGLAPQRFAPARTAPPADRLTVFHDFASPFSYLGVTRVAALAAARGVAVEWVPILLGGLFREIGTPDVPIATYSPARRAWTLADMHASARRHGVPFQFPSGFPLRTVLPLRVAVVAPEATPALYRAAWAEDRDVSTPEGVAAVLRGAGFDAEAVLARAAAPEVKAQLFANGARARATRVFGVPSFVVDDVLIWGQDRLELVALVLDGWRPRVDCGPP